MTVEDQDLLGRTVVQDDRTKYDDRSYIVRHWVGALSLPQSYWVNGVLIGLPFNIYFRIFPFIQIETLREYLIWGLSPFLISIPLLVWQWVGIWRSAGRAIDEGRPGWASVARLLIIVALLFFVRALFVTGKSVWSLSAAYIEETSAIYTVAQNGNIVTFSGKITPDSADRLEAALKKDGVNRLVIRQSVGGFVRPALRLARTIRDKKMTVVAISDCSSMCVVLLAVGAKRFVLPETIIRLHAATAAGTGDKIEDVDEAAADEEKKLYVSVGAGQDFLAKKQAHRGLLDFYEPTFEELIKNGLVTDVFDRQISAYLPAQAWCDADPDECRRTGRQNRAARGLKS